MYVEGGGSGGEKGVVSDWKKQEKTGKDEAEHGGKGQIRKDFISPIKEFILKTKMNN